MIYKDQLKRTILLEDSPKRIVSLVPSQTELLVNLGLENCIVGVTKFCIHPNRLIKSKVVVGGTKDVKIDKIKAIQPDIILCNKEENTEQIVASCSKICPVHVSDINSIEDCLELIRQYGRIFSIEKVAEILIEKIRVEANKFQKFIQEKKTRKVAYFIWRKPWMVAGNETYINYMLETNKLDNVFKDLKRYPEISLSNLKKQNPDLILLSSEPYPFKEKHVDEIMNVMPECRIILVDGEAFSWYGSHLLNSFQYFKKLHSEIEN